MIRLPRSFNVSSLFLVLALLLTLAVTALIAQDRAVQPAAIDVPGTWTQVATTGPTARSGLAMTFDPGRHKVVLFGGYDVAFTRLGDTWEWDGTAWLEVANSGPNPRGSTSL